MLQGGSQRIWKSDRGVWWFAVRRHTWGLWLSEGRVRAPWRRGGCRPFSRVAVLYAWFSLWYRTWLRIAWHTPPGSKCCSLLSLKVLGFPSKETNSVFLKEKCSQGHVLRARLHSCQRSLYIVGTAWSEFPSNLGNKPVQTALSPKLSLLRQTLERYRAGGCCCERYMLCLVKLLLCQAQWWALYV